MPFGIGHPQPTHQMQSTHVQEGPRVPNLQTEFHYLISFKSYGIFSDFVVPTSSPSSPHRPHSPQKVPMWSPWLWSLWSPWSPPHVVPVVPMVPMPSLSSPRHLCHPHIIPTLFRRSSHHPQSPRYPLHPPANPWGMGGYKSVKMQ